MKTRAVRLYGKDDLRLDEFQLPGIKEDEILAKVVSDSICMSTYKAVKQGTLHKRVPLNTNENPVIVGHEFAGELIEVGVKWKDKFKPGQKFSIQPALNYENAPAGILSAPGYSYQHIGGDATFIIIPNEVMEQDCLLIYEGEGFYPASLAEPLSCVIGAMHASYHSAQGTYYHQMGIRPGGRMALLGAAGPMGQTAINYAIHCNDPVPGLLIVTDINEARLNRAKKLYTSTDAVKKGITLKYINTSGLNDPVKALMELSGNKGYDDVFVFAPIPLLIEQADTILADNGCLNFFAGPQEPDFKAPLNFYNVHYRSVHVIGTTGGNSSDLKEALGYLSKGLDPAGLITHIGGLNAVIDTTLNLPSIPGGKKLIYTQINLPLTSISKFEEKGKSDPLFNMLNEICGRHNGLWSSEAEKYLLENAEKIN